MAINYQVRKCKNPKGDGSKQYYAGKFVKTSDYTFDELAQDIDGSTTVTEADAVAVLKAIKKFVTKALLAGRRVVLTDLGALQISLRGKCYPQEALADEEFSPASMIKGINVGFRPEAALLKNLRANYKLQRIASEVMP